MVLWTINQRPLKASVKHKKLTLSQSLGENKFRTINSTKHFMQYAIDAGTLNTINPGFLILLTRFIYLGL